MHQGKKFMQTRAVVFAGAFMVATSLLVACSGSSESEDKTSGGTTSTNPATNADVVLQPEGTIVATVDERFGSYNIEMVEVTGGAFWQPYDAGSGKVIRPPIDLASPKLRNLARALGPTYIRVSGSWAIDTWFDPDATASTEAPEGFRAVLTGEQWKGVGAFAKAVDGLVTTSFAGNDGVRDADGVWKPDQARLLLEFSKASNVPVVAAELFNEATLPVGMPKGYNADIFAKDTATFVKLRDEVAPDLKIVGPGSTADFTPVLISAVFTTEDILKLTGPVFDVFSFHSYPKVSERCGSQEKRDIAYTPEFLSRVETDTKKYMAVRDKLLPGAPVWLTETAQAACGGDRWAATYRDVVRYVDTLGQAARGGVDVVFHNTLAASDYALLEDGTFDPRPNYWAAVLWQRLMGTQVIGVKQPAASTDLQVFAHCTTGRNDGSVTYAVVNASTKQARTVSVGSGTATTYVLTADDLDGDTISLNGDVLKAGDDGTVPAMDGVKTKGTVSVPRASVAFVVLEGPAGNPVCAQ